MTERRFMGTAEHNVDCGTCIRRKTCERAEDGTFCGQWQSREPQPKGEDPNELWEKGEDVEF